MSTDVSKTISVFIIRVVELVWVWWAIQSGIYTCSGPPQGCFGSLVGGELSRLVLHENSRVRRENIKMRIWTMSSLKVEKA
jgi:hypothetical protein